MPRWKVTFGFRIGAIGGSESYITQVQSKDNVTPIVQRLIDDRCQLLHISVAIDKMRFALLSETQKRRSKAYPPGNRYVFQKPNANGEGGTLLVIPDSGSANIDNHMPDQARSILQTRVTFDTDRSSPHYLFGTPDKVLAQEPQSFKPELAASWNLSFIQFRRRLITDGWSVYARRRDAGFVPIDIQTWTQSSSSPANLGIVINSATSPGIAQKDIVQILSTRRKGTDRTSYNGKYVVDSVATGPGTNQFTVFLRGTEGGDPNSIKRLGQVQKIGSDYFPIEDYEGIQATTHKRGRPFGQQRGNRRKVPSLDF